jgi:hypothetical protein
VHTEKLKDSRTNVFDCGHIDKSQLNTRNGNDKGGLMRTKKQCKTDFKKGVFES